MQRTNYSKITIHHHHFQRKTHQNDMEGVNHTLAANQQEKAKKDYEKWVEAVMAHTQGKTKQGPDPELERLQEEVDRAHLRWVNSRQLQSLREKAIEGRDQKRRKVQFWREEVSTYMDRLIHERQEEDWYTDQYWGLIPIKVRQAERRCQEYEEMLAEFLTTDGAEPGEPKIHLQACILCGEIILGKVGKKESMARHMHHAHWSEM